MAYCQTSINSYLRRRKKIELDLGTLLQLRALCGKVARFAFEKIQKNLTDTLATQKNYFLY